MKTEFLLLAFLLFSLQCFAQNTSTYYNEWIDYEQTYYKFRIAEDGVYRIPYSALEEAGLANKNSEGFHLMSRGEETPIFLPSNGNALIEGDFIEFYGRKNDGTFDTQLFKNPDWQLTNRKSQFTDSITYYLLWDDSFEGKRIEVAENELSGELPEKEVYFMYESEMVHRNVFWFGEPTLITSIAHTDSWSGEINSLNNNFSDFEKGEGFVGVPIQGEKKKVYKIPTLGIYQGNEVSSAQLLMKIIGQNRSVVEEDKHHLQVDINGKIYVDETFGFFDTPIFEASIKLSDLDDVQTEIAYHSLGDFFFHSGSDLQAVSYAFLSYPRQFDFSIYESGEVQDATQFYFELQHLEEAYLEVLHFNGGNEAILYDLSNDQRFEIGGEAELYKIHLPQSNTIGGENRPLFLVNGNDETAIHSISSLQSTQFTDYTKIANQGDYIILSHPSLRTGEVDWIEAYGNYRSTVQGGNHSVVIVNIEELYDQFAHGIIKHPLAIRHFVNFALDHWITRPENLFLIGKGTSYRSTNTPSSFNANLIPTFGHQPSDMVLTARSIFDYRPQLGVGRLSVRTSEDVKNYLQKIQKYEDLEDCTVGDRAWRKHVLFQNNGNNEEEAELISEFLDDYENAITTTNFGAKILDRQAYINYDERFRTRPFIEQGISLLQFSGQSTGANWKTDILEEPSGYMSQSSPHFPVIFSGAAFVGNIFKSINSKKSLSESWVHANNKGAIGFLGLVSFDFWEGSDAYLTGLYQQFSQENYNQPIGKSLQRIVENIFIPNTSNPNHDIVKSMSQSFNWEGDPALVIGGGFERPEYVIENDYQFEYIDVNSNYQIKHEERNDVEIFSADGEELLSIIGGVTQVSSDEAVQLKIRVTNLGKALEENFTIQVSRQLEGTEDREVIALESVASPLYERIYTIDLPYLEGTNNAEVYEYFVGIDSENALEEDCEDNNEVRLRVSFSGCIDLAEAYADLAITNLQSEFCIGDPAIQLQANIGGGSFSITQVGGPTYNVNVFQPSQLGGGNYIVNYEVVDIETGCLFSVQEFTTIIEPIAAIAQVSLFEVCVGDVVEIQAAPTEGEYIWNFGQQGDYVFSGTVNTPMISWSTGGEKEVTLKVVEDGCESEVITQVFSVYEQVPSNFPIACDSGGDFIHFSWEADGAANFLIFANGILIAEVDGVENSYTLEGLTPDEEVEFRVVAVPYATCEEVSSMVTCKVACAELTPVISELANNSSYCADSPVIIDPPLDGTFIVTKKDVGEPVNYVNILGTNSLFPGSYTIVFEYIEGTCVYTSIEYEITITSPQVAIITDDLVICPDETVVLAVPDVYFGYQWSVSGENTYLLEVDEAGIYSIIVTDSNGCTATDAVGIVEAQDPEGMIFTSGGDAILCEGEEMDLQAPFGYESYIWSGNMSISDKLTVSEAGEYYVDYEDVSGCVWRSSITIEAAQTSEIEIKLSGELAILTIEGDFVEYLWSTGETGYSIAVETEGIYSVLTTDEYGCMAEATVEVMFTNVEVAPSNFDIEVYPNPVGNELFIGGENLSEFSLQLYDLSGKMVLSKPLEREVEMVTLEDLPSGVYVLELSGEKGIWREKIVKQ